MATAKKSPLFAEMKTKYEQNFMTKDVLKGRVRLGEARPEKGITKAEYKAITGEKYEA